MFSALRKNRESASDDKEQSARLVRHLLDEVEAGVVKGPACELDWLRVRFGELRNTLQQAATFADVSEVARAAVRHLREYNEAVTRHSQKQGVAVEGSRRLVNKTLTWAKAENEADISRGQTLMELLERGKGAGDLAATAVRISKAISFVREEWTSRRRQIALTIGQISEESDKLFGELQPESGRKNEAEAAPEADEPVQKQTEPICEATERDENPVTGLPGRHAGEMALAEAIANKRPVFINLLAIDQLGPIQSRYGDKMAEEILMYFGQQYAQSFDLTDHLFHWGRNTFLVLMEREGSKEWIRGQVERYFNVRFRKNALVNNRTVMLNVGSSWKMWAPSEVTSLDGIKRQITDFESEHWRDK